MTVKFLDLARLNASIREDLDAAYTSVLESGGFVGASGVADFEASFASLHGAAGAVGCGSGTDALTLALQAAGVGAGDEVVVPAMTFIATAEAAVHAGAVPVIADVNPESLLLDLDSVAAVRTSRTRAVIPVHLYGHVVPLDVVDAWREDGLVVVEDAAQAHLASWRGRSVGDAGQLACFSFYPGKNLGALGDGGLVLSNRVHLLNIVRRLRDHGRREKYVHEQVGWCSRLDVLQAAFLTAKLHHLAEWTDRRRAAAARYRTELGDLLVPWEDGAVHHLLVARFRDNRRDIVKAALAERGVETSIHFPVPLSRQPALARWARPCPTAEMASDQVLSLPMDPLMSNADIDTVVAALRGVM